MILSRNDGGRRRMKAVSVLAALLLSAGMLAGCTGGPAGSGAGAAGSTSSAYIDRIVKSGELRIGVAPAAPEVYQDPGSGQWKGIYVDAMQHVADELKVKLVPVSTSWKDIVAGLQAGKYDVAVGLNQTQARSQVLLYTNSLISVLTAFEVHKSGPNSWADISSPQSTVCVVDGTPQQKALQSLADFKANLQVLPSVDACRLAFDSGRVTANAQDWLDLAGYSAEHPDSGILFSPTPIALQGVGYGLPRDTSFADLATINAGLTEFASSGQLSQSLKNNATKNPLDFAVGQVPDYAKNTASNF